MGANCDEELRSCLLLPMVGCPNLLYTCPGDPGQVYKVPFLGVSDLLRIIHLGIGSQAPKEALEDCSKGLISHA